MGLALLTACSKSEGFLSADLKMHGLKGQVKKASVTEYQSDENGKLDFERSKSFLTFDENGNWTGNEQATFSADNIKRDANGRITSLVYHYVVNNEEDCGYDYKYAYQYDAGGRLQQMDEQYVGELCGGFEYNFNYDNADNVSSFTQNGGDDGVGIDSKTTYTIQETDERGNWTKRLVKEVSTAIEEYGEDQADSTIFTDYLLQIRNIEYYTK